MIPIANPKYVTNGRGWTLSEDDIVALLYYDESLNLSAKDIANGLFHRTKSAVHGRIEKHNRFRRRYKGIKIIENVFDKNIYPSKYDIAGINTLSEEQEKEQLKKFLKQEKT